MYIHVLYMCTGRMCKYHTVIVYFIHAPGVNGANLPGEFSAAVESSHHATAVTLTQVDVLDGAGLA